ncbi:MAG TPA: PPC domain-containing protein, partial [Longimicrobium sp.]
MMKHLWLPLAAAALAAGTASAQRPLVPGEITRGTLGSSDPRSDRGSYYDTYTFQGRRGEIVIVQMESRDFDAYLHLGTARRGTWRELAYDDDGGDGRNARLQLELPDDGTYTVRASSLSRSTGAYTLTLSNEGGDDGYY